ncbi:MAG TPA: hypothetical protein VFM13_00860 [Gaiellaceae bacterium]|nr:hypothetical protein [Gaiellaceae bacterium]
MSVDHVKAAVERSVPSYRGRTGDWEGVLERARHAPVRRDWKRPAAVVGAAILALVLFWPGDGGERILERARAAVAGGPVVHLVLQSRSQEFYDLRRGGLRRVPVEEELWFDESRGLRRIERIDGRVLDDVLYEAAGPEVARQFLGLTEVYRKALAVGDAEESGRSEIDGREVRWITFRVRYPEHGIASYDAEHRVAVDGETYEPVLWRAGGAEYRILSWETLPRGRGDFTAARTENGLVQGLYGATRVGVRAPNEAREVLPNAVWLGRRFGDLTLEPIRVMRYETGPWTRGGPAESLPGLELCYRAGESCAVTVSQTIAPQPMSGRGHGWSVTPAPGTLALADAEGLGYLVRDGVYVTIQADSREELIAAAKVLTPIP